MLLILFQEVTKGALSSPAETGVEGTISNLVLWLKLITELGAALLIGVGVVLTALRLMSWFRRGGEDSYERVRLRLARFLALALEFQLAADLLATTVAPSWEQIGKLGAIAVIRTALNYFLAREVKEEEEAISRSGVGARGALSET
ncbi:MAG: DUF1622 domain-containing protein [Rubrobacter sp.]